MVLFAVAGCSISIHALRVEGDRLDVALRETQLLFLSTPSGWRATAKTDKVFICFCAKGRRNCLFKTRKEKICRWRFKKDKFWVLIWCEGSGKSVCALASHCGYLVPCLSLLSSECVVFTDVPRDFQRLAEYFSDGWRREGVIDSSCLFKIGAEVRTVRWKISNNTHPVPVLNNTHPFPSKCSVDALCRVRESVRFASERSRVRIPPGPPSKKP